MTRFVRASLLLTVLQYLCMSVLSQTIEISKKPRAIEFKDAGGTVVTSIPLQMAQSGEILEMAVSQSSGTAYVLNPSDKSKNKSVSAVNLSSMQVAKVIDLGKAQEVNLSMSSDGRRLLCYALSGVMEAYHPLHGQRHGNTDTMIVIDTNSNEIIERFDLLNHKDIPGKGPFLASSASISPDGAYVIGYVAGLSRLGKQEWRRLVIYSTAASDPPVIVDPGEPLLAMTFSDDDGFLFVAAADKERKSELVHVIELRKGTVVSREIDNPPTKRDRLGAFLGGAPPVGLESKQGIWVFTSAGVRYMTQDGNMGNEVPIANQESAAAILSLNRDLLLLAAPSNGQNAGTLQVVDLRTGNSHTHSLSDVPVRMVRLGSKATTWLVSSREMRMLSENGEVGERAILLNKPPSQAGLEQSPADLSIDGDVGGAITLGDGRAAILIVNKKGGSLHRVAVLDLKEFRVENVITTMTKGDQSRIIGQRWLQFLGAAAMQGAIEGAVTGATGVPSNLFSGYASAPSGIANEAIAASSNGQTLYVLNTDTHKVTVVNVQSGKTVGFIPVDDSTTMIWANPDGKHLTCAGFGYWKYLKMVDVSPNATQGN